MIIFDPEKKHITFVDGFTWIEAYSEMLNAQNPNPEQNIEPPTLSGFDCQWATLVEIGAVSHSSTSDLRQE